MVYLKAGGRSVNLIYLVVSIHCRPQASMAAIFRQSAGYVIELFTFYAIFVRRMFRQSNVTFQGILITQSVVELVFIELLEGIIFPVSQIPEL